MEMTTNEYQNMDEQTLSEELRKMTKEKNELYDELNKVALEGQKWRDRCVGLEASNKELNKKYEVSYENCRKWEGLYKENGEKYCALFKENAEQKKEYADLVKENENLDTLILSFRLVLQETYRKIKPLKCERNTK